MNKISFIFLSIVFATPLVAFSAEIRDADSLFSTLGDWLNTIAQLIIAATVVAIFWGLFQFIFNEEKKDEGKRMMTWGILALFVMVSIWGIVYFLQSTVGTTDSVAPSNLDRIVPKIKN